MGDEKGGSQIFDDCQDILFVSYTIRFGDHFFDVGDGFDSILRTFQRVPLCQNTRGIEMFRKTKDTKIKDREGNQ